MNLPIFCSVFLLILQKASFNVQLCQSVTALWPTGVFLVSLVNFAALMSCWVFDLSDTGTEVIPLSVHQPLPLLSSSFSLQNNDNETPLHCAAQYGHTQVVQLLLEELTDPTMRNNKFETPLDLAALYGRLEVVKLLLSAHPNLLSSNTKKHTPLHLASRNGHLPVVEVLLAAGVDINYQVRKSSSERGQGLCWSFHTLFMSISRSGLSRNRATIHIQALKTFLNEITSVLHYVHFLYAGTNGISGNILF